MNISNNKNFIPILSFISAIIISFIFVNKVDALSGQKIDMHKNCVDTVFPDNIERNIAIDPDSGMIFVNYEENNIKKEVILSLANDIKYSECSGSARELISMAQNVSNKINNDTCVELRDITSGSAPISTIDGEKMDIKAINDYINKYCQ